MPPPNTPEDEIQTAAMSYHRNLNGRVGPQRRRNRWSTSTSASTSTLLSASASPSPFPPSPTRCSTLCGCIPSIDYQSLDYETPVDQALQCPICHTPFYMPLTTSTCGHTFCTECISRSLETQPVCPIDRQPVNTDRDLYRARVICDQLDRLKVKCPSKGCGLFCTRELLPAHYNVYCEYVLVHCPDPTCSRRVPRADAHPDNGCLHRNIVCTYCESEVMIAELEEHYDTSCYGHTAKCSHCNAVVVRHLMDKHLGRDCPGTKKYCRFRSHGCKMHDTRPAIEEHERLGCVYQAIGELKSLRLEDRARIEDLEHRLDGLDARMKRKTSPPTRPRVGSSSFMGGFVPIVQPESPRAAASAAANSASWGSTEDYMLVQFERLEAEIERAHTMILESDSQHTMRQINDLLRFNEQIYELTNRVGALSLQIRSLAVTTQQHNNVQGRAGAANGTPSSSGISSPGGGGAGTRGQSHEDGRRYHSNPPAMSRRSSDGRGQHPPRL
ncbi:putative ubiquitin fusion degradation protein [Lasiosphaeria ovina]|uniref:Ubiquitin fusion degradation protein n=1 Tax=Lasiosphaeria ovina TaxID=92902 RepID=A0AAE0JSK9_9PEZI|nr:putative ubiquitin fusion degradation protein [Lasiosphaeria ovina]